MATRRLSRKPSRQTVSVGCKLPNGFILKLYNMVDDVERGIGGTSKNIKVARLVSGAPIITLNGSRRNPDVPLDEQPSTMFGFGITHGVPLDFMERWLHDNAETDYVKAGLIFISANETEVRAEAKDKRSLRTGLEPIKPDGDLRMPRKKGGVGAVTSAVKSGDDPALASE